MYSDLDKKLEAYYAMACHAASSGYEIRKGEWLRQVKQAFIDDGWIKIPTATMTREGHIEVSTDKGVNFRGVPLMSKEEWERQAIKDGWVKSISFLDIPEGNKSPVPDWVSKSPHIMRGDEFFIKFSDQLKLKPAVMDLHLLPGKVLMDIEDVKEAAKKAAGIE